MKPIQISIHSFIDNPNHSYASIIDDPVQLKLEHCHNYYELFIVNKGFGKHNVNGTIVPIEQGTLVFIRPNDLHNYVDVSENFSIINVLIPVTVIGSLFDYLGAGFEPERLLNPELPPMVELNQFEFAEIVSDLEQLVFAKRILKENSDSIFRIVLMRIITKCFPISIARSEKDVPTWLKWLVLEMHKKENFLDGLRTMYRLCARSPEHLGRMCKKHFDKTPTQLINEIRCEYAARMITYTDMKIIEIAYDAGFGNLSHFYHTFGILYGVPPNKFREIAVHTDDKESLIQKNIVDSTAIKEGISLKHLYDG